MLGFCVSTPPNYTTLALRIRLIWTKTDAHLIVGVGLFFCVVYTMQLEIGVVHKNA